MGHHPRSSAAFLPGQALSCFSREECSVAHVLRIVRRRAKHSIFKDIAADPFDGSCVHRHGALNRFFSCSRYMCAAVQRWRLVLTHVFLKTFFFFSCALGLAFSSLHAVDACSTVFIFLCAVDACSIVFLCTALQRLTPSKVNGAQLCQWRKGEG